MSLNVVGHVILCSYAWTVCSAQTVTIFSAIELFGLPGTRIPIECGCQPACNTFQWYFDGNMVAFSVSGYSGVEMPYQNNFTVIFDVMSLRSTLTVIISEQSYGRKFYCAGKLPMNNTIVHSQSTVTFFKPVFPYNLKFSPSDFVHQDGIITTIKCSAEGTPAPNITLTVEPGLMNTPLSVSPDDVMGRKTTKSLTYKPIRSDNGKIVTCTAHNLAVTAGQSSPKISSALNVTYGPGPATIVNGPTITLAPRETTNLQCSVTDAGNPASIHFMWKKEAIVLVEYGTASYLISSASVDNDDGTYCCTARNYVTVGSAACTTVIVNSNPVFVNAPSPVVTLANNESLSELCSVKARPEATIAWTSEIGVVINSNVFAQQSFTRTDGKYTTTTNTLTWKSGVSKQSKRSVEGTYKCVASNSVKPDVASGQMMLVVNFAPEHIKFNLANISIDRIAGTDPSVTCSADCKPDCTYSWGKTGDSSFTIQSSQVLSLTNLSKTATGNYECAAKNTYGNIKKKKDPTVNYIQATLSIAPSSLVTEGQDITLTCDIDSNPTMYTVRWIQDSGHILQDGPSNVLHVNDISYTDDGRYTCAVDNSKMNKVVSGTLNVRYYPRKNVSESSPSVLASVFGSMAELKLVVHSNPAPTAFQWFYGSKQLSEFYVGPFASTLVISKTNASTYSQYTCAVGHTVKNVNFSFRVNPIGCPEHPSQFIIVKKTAVSVTLSWLVEFDGGQPQLFVIHFKNISDVKWRTIPEMKAAGFHKIMLRKVPYLRPDTSYSFRLSTRNHYNKSCVREVPYNLRVTTKEAPFVPIKMIRVKTEGNMADVSWPAVSSDLATHAEVSYCKKFNSSDCQTVRVPSNQTSVTVPVLAGESYIFTLTLFDGNDQVYQYQSECRKMQTKKKKVPTATLR